MKSFTSTCVLLASFTLFVSDSYGQEQTTASSAINSLFAPKHIVKTNLAGYAFRSVTMNYETKTGAGTSVGLLSGYKLSQTLAVSAVADLSSGAQTYTGEITPEGWFVNPYFRWYPKETFKGFFVEVFTRYYDYDFQLPYEYEKNEETIEAQADGTASAFGGGVSIGWQFNIAPRWYVDIGLGGGLANGNIHIETNDDKLDAQDYADIKDAIEDNRDTDIDIPLLNDFLGSMEADADENSAWVDFNNVLVPISRGGVSIGFAF